MTAFLIAAILVIPAAAWRAWMASFLWAWFLTPVFGIAVPSLWFLAGLMMVVSFLTPTRAQSKDKTEHELLGEMIGTGFVVPGIIVLFAWPIAALAGAI